MLPARIAWLLLLLLAGIVAVAVAVASQAATAAQAPAPRAKQQQQQQPPALQAVEERDPQRWLADHWFRFLREPGRITRVDRWIFVAGWLHEIRSGCASLPSDDADDAEPATTARATFRTFASAPPASRTALVPSFDLLPLFEDTYGDSEQRCLGRTDETTLLYRSSRDGRRFHVRFARTRAEGWIIAAIDDPLLRFCLIDSPHPTPEAESAMGDPHVYALVSPATAIHAARGGGEDRPAGAHGIEWRDLSHWVRAGWPPPRSAPLFIVASTDTAQQTIRIGRDTTDHRLGQVLLDALDRPFRLVAIGEETATFRNWAEVAFEMAIGELRMEADILGRYDGSTVGRDDDSTDDAAGDDGDDNADDSSGSDGTDTPPQPVVTDAPYGLRIGGPIGDGVATIVRVDPSTGDISATLEVRRGDEILDAHGRPFIVRLIRPTGVILADARGQGYQLRR